MSDIIDETIQDIAIKHGVVLSKDDPVLILQTMNEKLLEDNRKAQQVMLAQFKEEMENISSQWKDDAKGKAEKTLNAALVGSKEAMARLLQESTSESVHVMRKMILDSLDDARDLAHQTRKFSRFALFSSAVIMTGAYLLMLLFLIHILG